MCLFEPCSRSSCVFLFCFCFYVFPTTCCVNFLALVIVRSSVGNNSIKLFLKLFCNSLLHYIQQIIIGKEYLPEIDNKRIDVTLNRYTDRTQFSRLNLELFIESHCVHARTKTRSNLSNPKLHPVFTTIRKFRLLKCYPYD